MILGVLAINFVFEANEHFPNQLLQKNKRA